MVIWNLARTVAANVRKLGTQGDIGQTGALEVILVDETGKPASLAEVTLQTTDIEIGAVELKNGADDTRAVIGANGLEVEVKAQAAPATLPLPTGAATEDSLEAVETATEALVTATGEVQATPTSNTILGRLKDLLTGIVLATGSNVIGSVTDAGHGWTAIKKYANADSTDEHDIWEPTAGKKFVVTDLIISQATAAGVVTIKDGAAGTTVLVLSLAQNGGAAYQFRTPLISAANDNHLTVTNTAGSTHVSALGYEI